MSSTFEHLDIEFEEINKLGVAEIIALKGEGGVLSEQVKQTLLECFKNVAWVNEHGQDYVDALRNALYPPPYLVRISAIYTQSGTIYPTDSLDDLREDLVVTATYSNGVEMPVTAYALSGTLQVGESIITVSYGGKIAIFEVEVTRVAETYTITNNLTGASNSNSATYVTEGNSYSATITANESHTLDGATISITMGGVDITSTAYDDGAISIAEVTGDLVINVVAVAIVLENISAVYTQSGTIYDTDSLDDLRTDLVVTATYSDSSTEIIPSTDYTLSGTLEVGTSTIYVVYSGKTTTFTVIVSNGWRYLPSMGKLSDQDFATLSTSGTLQITESISNGALWIYASPQATDKNTNYGFTPSTYTSRAYLKVRFKIADIAFVTSSGIGYFTFRISNGASGTRLGFARKNTQTGNGKLRYVIGSTETYYQNDVALNVDHTLEIINENGKQTIKLDGATVANAVNPTTQYVASNRIYLFGGGTTVNPLSVYVYEIEYNED